MGSNLIIRLLDLQRIMKLDIHPFSLSYFIDYSKNIFWYS